MSKNLASLVLALILIGVFGLAIRVPKVEATIYIKADGSIDPPTANITSVDNVTYIFTGNVNDSIAVQRDNIVIDGADFSVQGAGSLTGISLYERSNVTIKRVHIRNFTYGIYIYESSNNTVISSNITANSDQGVYVRSSTHSNITGNNIANNGEDGVFLLYSSNSSIYGNNIVDSEAGIHLQSSSHHRIFGNNITDNGGLQVGGGVWLDRADFNTLSGNNITASGWHGIQLERASNNSISENEITAGTNRAIYVDYYSDYNNITGNRIIDNYKGIELSGSSHYNTISGNNMTLNGEGIHARYSDYNSIFGNNITDNGNGIMLSDPSNNNSISGNIITDSGNGITVGSSNNSIYGNIITGGNAGISIQHSSNNTLRDNTMANNRYNFLIMAYNLPNFLNDVDDSNTVDDKPIYYWIDSHDSTIPSDAGCVILANCTNISIRNVNISHNWQGVAVALTTNATIAESNITNTQYCIWLWNSSNCYINENYVSHFIGIQLEYSSNNTIYGNTITGCGNWGGVGVVESYDNTFFGNNFTDNYIHVKIDVASANNWDDGYPEGGNYWDNFKYLYPHVNNVYSGPYQNETGSDNFWDSQYTINADNIDQYPIVPEFTSIIILPLFMIVTLLTVKIYRRKNIL